MQTMQIIFAFIFALIPAMIITGALIPYMENKQFRQFIREEGPQSHMKKAGTPSMGGLAIIAGTAISSIIVCGINAYSIALIGGMLLFGFIGFVDDYEKVLKKQNLGLRAWQKIVMQLLFSGLFGAYVVSFTETGTEVYIPFFDKYADFGMLFIPFVIFVMVAFSNAVNLTDGLDGLASGVTAIVACAMAVIGLGLKFEFEPRFMVALCGACIGFLFFNRNPARIFMGDTGSMALGGALSAAAILMRMEFILAIAGLIYVAEAASVVIQVGVYKLKKKRVFRMAPLHHHFELGGMKETKVVLMFWCLTFVFCIPAVLLAL